MPFFAAFDVPIINGTWVPPLWFGILCVPLGILVLVLSLHLLNAWGWVCARWAEVMFRVAGAGRAAGAAGASAARSAGLRRSCSRGAGRAGRRTAPLAAA